MGGTPSRKVEISGKEFDNLLEEYTQAAAFDSILSKNPGAFAGKIFDLLK